VAAGQKVNGPAVVDGLTLSAGKTLTIHSTGQLDNVVLNKGAKVDVTGGRATRDALQAKTMHANLGTIAPALMIGTPQNPYPFHIKHLVDDARPKTEGPLHVTVPPAKIDPSTVVGRLASTVVGRLASTVVGRLVGTVMSSIATSLLLTDTITSFLRRLWPLGEGGRPPTSMVSGQVVGALIIC
jgi:hypothetical protein